MWLYKCRWYRWVTFWHRSTVSSFFFDRLIVFFFGFMCIWKKISRLNIEKSIDTSYSACFLALKISEGRNLIYIWAKVFYDFIQMDSFLKNIMQLAILTIYNIYNKNYFRKKLVPPSLIFELVFCVYTLDIIVYIYIYQNW